jgi:hypothetical protein
MDPTGTPNTEHAHPDSGTPTDLVTTFRKQVARLVQHRILTHDAAVDVHQAFERALRQSYSDQCALTRLISGLLYALEHSLLPAELSPIDAPSGVVTFQRASTLSHLTKARLLDESSLPRLRHLLRHAHTWFPECGLSVPQKRVTFGPGARHTGLTLDLSRARSFLKRANCIPGR